MKQLDLFDEHWRAIPGWEGHYEVSDIGRARSVTREIPHARYGTVIRNGRLRKLHPDKDGYLFFSVSRDDYQKNMWVHRAVTMAFIGNPPFKKACVNHKDGVKTNNHSFNLEWVTFGENTRHGWKLGLMKRLQGEECASAKLRASDVLEIRKQYNEYVPHQLIAAAFGISAKYIWEICARKTWVHI